MRRLLALLPAGLLLAGCLEVDQYPRWVHGEYDGKPDHLPWHTYFRGDPLAWMAATTNRNWKQDEYPRTLHKGAPYEHD